VSERERERERERKKKQYVQVVLRSHMGPASTSVLDEKPPHKKKYEFTRT